MDYYEVLGLINSSGGSETEVDVPESEVMEFISLVDSDKNGRIDMDEFFGYAFIDLPSLDPNGEPNIKLEEE